MATRNINNYINELLNEVHEPGHTRTYPNRGERVPLTPERQKKDDAIVADGQKDLDRYDRIQSRVRAETDRNTKMAQDSRAKVDASLASSKDFAQELAAYKAQDKARRARIAGLRSGQGTNQEREARITDSRKAIMSDVASNILKGFGAGRSTARAEVERRPVPAGRPSDGRPAREARPAYINRPPSDGRPDRITTELPRRDLSPDLYRRPDDGRPTTEFKPKYHDRRPDDGRYDNIPTYTKKPESFPSRGGKNKRLAIAAQADKTGDAYMAQVMGQGKGTPSSEKYREIEKIPLDRDKFDRLPGRHYLDIETARDTFNRGGGSNIMPNMRSGALPIRDTKERRQGDDLISARMNRGSNPQARPPRPGEKPRSLSGEIESDFIDYRKPKRMR